jgi:colanic acid/amylovoran biosynthesis glycosyltransferase
LTPSENESGAPDDARAPLRIAVLVDRFPALSETFVTNEIRELRRLGHHVRVEAIAPAPAPDWAAAGDVPLRFMADERLLPKIADMAWLVARHPLRSLRDVRERSAWRAEERVVPLRALARRARRMRRERIDHLHVHFATRSALEGMRIGRLLGVPYSVTVHAFDVFASPANVRVKLERSAFSTSVCEYTLDALRALVGPEHRDRLRLVTMGVDVDRFRRSDPYPGGRTVLTIGRLVEKKGLRFLVDAAALLRDRGAVDRVVVVGEGPLRADLEARIQRHGLSGVVDLLGARGPAEVRALIESADLLAMPSVIAPDGDRDSMPVAVFEALAMEVPVVASDLVGLPEHVRPEWGRLVAPGDADALADAIAAILALPRAERVAMGAAARHWAEEHCNGRIEAARLADLIRGAQPAISSR